MEHTKDILCPDCEENYISQKVYEKQGKCTRCRRREVFSANLKKPYIKFKELSDEEKKQYAIIRERNAKYRAGRKERDSKNTETKITKNNKTTENNSDKEQTNKERSNAVYNEQMIQELKLLGKPNISVKELLDAAKQIYPDKAEKLNYGNLYNIVKRFKILHKGRNAEDNNVEIASASNKVYVSEIVDFLSNMITEDKTIDQICSVIQSYYPNLEVTTEKVEKLLMKHSIIFKEIPVEDYIEKDETELPVPQVEIEQEIDDRFEPIRKEVNSVVSKKFKQLDCELQRNYTTQDYINMLEMLHYLSSNVDNIIKARRDQHDIMNAYQSDALHENENEIAKPGDTYLSDKLHIIRTQRRYYEYDCADLSIMQDTLYEIAKLPISNIIKSLTNILQNRNNPIFIPMVDCNMVDKYQWASSGTLSSAKVNKPILTSNRKLNKDASSQGEETYSPARNGNKLFRVSCELSGGGYGAFRHWHRDYFAYNEEIALSKGRNDLNNLASQRPGLIYSNLTVHKLNQ